MKKISVKIEINSPIEKVWEILTNINAYSEWNPFVYDVSADKKIPNIDCNMLFYVAFSNGKKVQSKEFVTKFEAPKMHDNNKALWVYRFDGILHKLNIIRATRTQSLKALSDTKTEYSSEEIFSGLAKSFVPFGQVQKGFMIQAESLKAKCESKKTE